MGGLSSPHGSNLTITEGPRREGIMGKQWRAKWNTLFDFPTFYRSQRLASPENVGWKPNALEGSNVVSHPEKGWKSWSWKRRFTRRIARSRATIGYIPIANRGPPLFPNPPPPLCHHHHITIMIITCSIAHPVWGLCWVAYIHTLIKSHSHTPLHLGNWGLEKPNDLSQDTAGQMVQLEIEQICLNPKPMPSTSMPYTVSLVLDKHVRNRRANG